MSVSVIIVNYKTRDLLGDAIESVMRLTVGVRYEIIVVDNASHDGSREMLSLRYPAVKLIEMPENVGFGRANNEAVKVATGDFLFFLNSDTKLLNDAISLLAAFLETHPDCGACGGNLVGFDGRPLHSFERRFPGPLSDIRRFTEFLPAFLRPAKSEYNPTGRPYAVAYVTGADLMIRRGLFQELNGFDPGFFMYYEETDLCLRITRAGLRIFSVPEARIAHLKGASLSGLLNSSSHYYLSKYRYMRKNHGAIGFRVAHAAFLSFCFVKLSAYLLTRKKSSRSVISRNIRAANTAYGRTKKTIDYNT